MSKWLAVAVVVVLGAGCNYGAGAFKCASSTDCTGAAGGTCEPNGFCSFDDTSCPAPGRRYGDLSGGVSGKCVGEEEVDAGTKPPEVDARTCFGTAPFTVCLVNAPTMPMTISATKTINTDDPSMCEAVEAIKSGGDGYCVLAATSITIDAKLRATGTKPLVLLASGSITTSAAIDVGSHRGESPETGAGADPTTCGTGTPPVTGIITTTSGGGAGGSFTGPGGIGGAGGGGGGAGGVPGGVTSIITTLRGGCAGQDGAGIGKGIGGHGGGTVYLIAGTGIDIGGSINAAGEGGNAAIMESSGGGGGGAGGMIGLDAPVIAARGLILANGGGGGQGSGSMTPGRPGADPSGITAASGGIGGGTASTNGGNGGEGSAGAAAGPGAPGNPGANNSGGGGAGGGGAGLVKAPATASLGTQVSPLPTP